MVRLDDIQKALNLTKKSEKIEMNFYEHFWTSDMMKNDETARPSLTQTDRDGLFLENYNDIQTVLKPKTRSDR